MCTQNSTEIILLDDMSTMVHVPWPYPCDLDMEMRSNGFTRVVCRSKWNLQRRHLLALFQKLHKNDAHTYKLDSLLPNFHPELQAFGQRQAVLSCAVLIPCQPHKRRLNSHPRTISNTQLECGAANETKFLLSIMSNGLGTQCITMKMPLALSWKRLRNTAFWP